MTDKNLHPTLIKILNRWERVRRNPKYRSFTEKILSQPVHEVTMGSKLAEVFNTLNRTQDYAQAVMHRH